MPYKDPDVRRAYWREYSRSRALAYRLDRTPKMRGGVCKQGHPMVDDNVYRRRNGTTECRICKRQRLRDDRASMSDVQRKQYNLQARARTQDRRARLRKMFVEHVDPRVLYVRDKGLCGICSLRVDHDRFDVDHVIPLDPGEHSYANTQIAHPCCNNRKHRKIGTTVGLGRNLVASDPT